MTLPEDTPQDNQDNPTESQIGSTIGEAPTPDQSVIGSTTDENASQDISAQGENAEASSQPPETSTQETTSPSSAAESVPAPTEPTAEPTVTPPSESITPTTSPTTAESSPSKLKKKSSTSSRKKGKQIDLETAKIGIIGAGKMCEALVDGLINFGRIAPQRIHVACPTSKNLDRYKQLKCHTTKRNIDIFARYDCDIIFLAFHGGVVKYCYKLGGSRPHPITTNYIPNMKHAICILSMVSGVNLEQIKAVLLNPEHPKNYILEIHRIMLNAACAYGIGVCAIDVEPDSSQLSSPIRTLLSLISRLEYVPESQMDAACAIGGNGLSFGYYFINAMADGAFKMGLSRNMALKFAAKTIQCGAQCLLESGRHPSEMRDAVSAAGGPAIYGIHVLDKADVASGITAAVEAAYKRASELAETEIVTS